MFFKRLVDAMDKVSKMKVTPLHYIRFPFFLLVSPVKEHKNLIKQCPQHMVAISGGQTDLIPNITYLLEDTIGN